MNLIEDVIRSAEDALRRAGVDRPRFEAQLLAAHVLAVSRQEILLGRPSRVSDEQKAALVGLVEKKVAGAPTAYLVGQREFFSLDFIVSPAVLIPRPETEELLEWVLAEAHDRDMSRVLDLCTGSGCIGIVLARELAVEELTLLDVSADALAVASKNCQRLLKGFPVEMVESYLFREIADDRVFELVVSNPPYVLPSEYATLQPGVRDHEPRLALEVTDAAEF